MLKSRPLSQLFGVFLVVSSLLLTGPLIAELQLSDRLLNRIEVEYNPRARERLEDWQDLMSDPANHALDDKDKLTLVNDFFNSRVLFMDDIDLWDVEDYWATPVETLAVGAGDCEDYAIAKYFTLLQLGMDDSKLRITYVKATEINQAHMVLTYFENRRAIPLVLDNLITEIKPANKRQDLVPVYSFNGSGLYLAGARDNRVGDASRLSLWDEVTRRLKQQLAE
ncbi:transglutaminase-like cysteine peptidase [Methylophaga lonarensis]|uniref:transglutaminase-like cysteine peptidase n=1 Tax=Methylophaga lonarensis TaxID=999151 RepID=UPI003D2C0D29